MKKQLPHDNIKKLVTASLCAALVVVTTMFLSIPVPGAAGAYINGGDVMVYVSAFLLGGGIGGAAAGIGSALADLLLGSAIYAPATLVIKALMAVTASLLLKRAKGVMRLAVLALCGAIMTAGYFLYEWLIYGMAAALAGIPFNLIQLAGGAVIGYIVITALGSVRR